MSRARNLPRLDSYEAALARYHATKPRPDGVRPLGKRRDWEVFKIEHHNGLGQGYVDCIMRSTKIVTFTGDGRLIVKTGGWDTRTTRAALNALLPTSVRVYARKGETILSLNGGVYRLKDVPWLVADPTAPAGWIVPHPNHETVHTINRKRANAVLRRPEYREFMLYAKGLLSALVEGGTGELDVGEAYYEHRQVIPTRTAWTWAIPAMLAGEYVSEWEQYGTPEHHERMFAAVILALRGVLDATRGRYMAPRRDRRDSVWATPAQVLAVIRRGILRWHADEVLDKVTLGAGEIRDDEYEAWTRRLPIESM